MTGSALKPLAPVSAPAASASGSSQRRPAAPAGRRAVLLYLGGGKGDNAGVMRRIGGVFVALAIIGLAVSAPASTGKWLANLFTG